MRNHGPDGRTSARHRPFVVAALLMLGVVASAGAAGAEPIRIIVNFTVVGSPSDPEFGSATASGFVSVVTTQDPGTEVLLPGGFGAEALSFSWGGVTWDTSNADVYLIGREASGRIGKWAAGGSPAGFDGLSASAAPDFRVVFCVTDDINVCSSITFEYTTALSPTLGVFTGFVPNFSIQRQPLDAPVPEPMTLLLVGSGLGALAVRRRRADPRSTRRQ